MSNGMVFDDYLEKPMDCNFLIEPIGLTQSDLPQKVSFILMLPRSKKTIFLIVIMVKTLYLYQ